MSQMQISNKVASIPEALSIYINNIVYTMRQAGYPIKVLSLGEAYFKIPLLSFDNIDFEKGYHYTESRGIYDLREKIAKYYSKNYDVSIDPRDEILISAGSKPLIYMAFQAVLNPGDEVLIHEPAWLSYPEEIKLADGVPDFIPYNCPVEEFENYFTEKTRMIVINNPNNPAGRTYTREELETLYKMCRPRGIYILVDEAYSDFITDDSFVSMANVVPDKDGIIIVNSLSKNFGISGWRIGYVISTPELIFNILKLNQHLITCAPSILLLYLNEHFDELLALTLPQAQAVVEKRNQVNQYAKSIGLRALPGSATFYLFFDISDYGRSSLDFAMFLLAKYHIAVVPGSAYGASTDHFIRVGVGTETVDDLKACLDTINSVIKTKEFDDGIIDAELAKLNLDRFIANE